ncbi:MAG: hypothetical protein Q7K57_07110 [Burkholderiaceae bacterium]|nr:hypothetical protein [Burkholderiaceae bacterium]
MINLLLADDVAGQKTGRLLHGAQIAPALNKGESIHGIELVNYKRQGQPYWYSSIFSRRTTRIGAWLDNGTPLAPI